MNLFPCRRQELQETPEEEGEARDRSPDLEDREDYCSFM